MLATRQILTRLALTVPTLAGVLLVSFFLTRLSGDPTNLLLPVDATDAARAAFRAQNGLDQPLSTQLVHFAIQVVQGDFGQSLRFSEPAARLVAERLPATLELGVATLVLALLGGVGPGIAAAYWPGGAIDRLVRWSGAFSQALPPFYIGIVAILIFSVQLRLLPTGGRGAWNSVILPAATLALSQVGLIAQLTRVCMTESLQGDYIRTARAKGLTEWLVVIRHAARNACLPVVTLVGLQTGTLMGGVVVTETVFAWPGVGRLAIQAIYARDFPVVQAVVFFAAVVFVSINLAVDVLQTVLDPRLRDS